MRAVVHHDVPEEIGEIKLIRLILNHCKYKISACYCHKLKTDNNLAHNKSKVKRKIHPQRYHEAFSDNRLFRAFRSRKRNAARKLPWVDGGAERDLTWKRAEQETFEESSEEHQGTRGKRQCWSRRHNW
jgi:hypothetical protein